MKLKPVRRTVGLLFLADGIRAFAYPTEYPRNLQIGSPLIDDILDYFAEHPRLTRKFALTEMALGLWLVLR